MSWSAGVAAVMTELIEVGYRVMPSPIEIASIPFDFDASLLGPENVLDLVFVVDTSFIDAETLGRNVRGVAGALDVIGSRRSLTTVLVGPPIEPDAMRSLSVVSRVLRMDTPTGEAVGKLRDALRALLPLKATASESETSPDPLSEVRKRLIGRVSRTEGVDDILLAAIRGRRAVTEALNAAVASVCAEGGLNAPS